jgi:hypothetical protein
MAGRSIKLALLAAALCLVPAALPLGASASAAPQQYMVGFSGTTFPASVFTSVGMSVDAVYPSAGFALVTTSSAAQLSSLAGLTPGITYVVSNGPIHADSASWDSSSWDSASWDSSSWDTAQWGSVNGSSATWDSSSWDSASWDSSSWDTAQWGTAQWGASQWDGGRYAGGSMPVGFGNEWQLGAIHAPAAWNVTTAYHALIVCVVDSGVDYTHPVLASNMLPFPNGTYGYDFVNGDNDPMDDAGHGTMMAGIIAAQMTNSGVTGVSQAYLRAAKVLNATGSGTEANLALAIRWCVDTAGAKIINLSLHISQDNTGVHNAISYAHTKGALVVAAAGNEGNVCGNCVDYPAAYSETMAVGAVMPNGTRAPFSNGGSALTLVAPGVYIPGPLPGDRYGVGSGTSHATAVASGSAALVWAAKPNLNNDGVRQALKQYAKLPAGVTGFTYAYGNGYLRLDRTFSGLGLI